MKLNDPLNQSEEVYSKHDDVIEGKILLSHLMEMT